MRLPIFHKCMPELHHTKRYVHTAQCTCNFLLVSHSLVMCKNYLILLSNFPYFTTRRHQCGRTYYVMDR